MNGKTNAVANQFIAQGVNRGEPVTIMRLVKLMYFAQGIAFVELGNELFPDEIEAWQYGPVVRSVYAEAKRFGNVELNASLGKRLERKRLLPAEIDLINSVDRAFAKVTAYGLVKATHEPGTPWATTYKPGFSNVIPKQLISDWFSARAQASHG